MKDFETSHVSQEIEQPDVMTKIASIAKAALCFLLKILNASLKAVGKCLIRTDPLYIVISAVGILAAAASMYCAAYGY